ETIGRIEVGEVDEISEQRREVAPQPGQALERVDRLQVRLRSLVLRDKVQQLVVEIRGKDLLESDSPERFDRRALLRGLPGFVGRYGAHLVLRQRLGQLAPALAEHRCHGLGMKRRKRARPCWVDAVEERERASWRNLGEWQR